MNKNVKERARILSGYLDRAIRQQLGLLKLPPPGKDDDLAGQWLTSDQVARIVAAAQVPLVGWDSLVPPNWLAHYNPIPHWEHEEYDVVMYGPRARGIAPVTTTWGCVSPGTFRKLVQERENYDICEDKTFQFREDGALLRTSTYDYITATFVEKDVAVEVRSSRDDSQIAEEIVFAAIVALRHAVDAQQLSLRGLTPAGLPDKLVEVEQVSLRLAVLLSEPEVKILRGIGAEAMELVSKQFSSNVRSVRVLMEKHKKQKEARIACMGPLKKCFTLLFGESQKRKKSEKGSVDPGLGPFVRFAMAFLEEIGCGCQPSTVRAAEKTWRRRQGITL